MFFHKSTGYKFQQITLVVSLKNARLSEIAIGHHLAMPTTCHSGKASIPGNCLHLSKPVPAHVKDNWFLLSISRWSWGRGGGKCRESINHSNYLDYFKIVRITPVTSWLRIQADWHQDIFLQAQGWEEYMLTELWGTALRMELAFCTVLNFCTWWVNILIEPADCESKIPFHLLLPSLIH